MLHTNGPTVGIGSNHVLTAASHLVILWAIMMVDTHKKGLVLNQVGGKIMLGMIQEVETDIARMRAGVPLWEDRAGAPSVVRICATQESSAHSERTSVHGSNAIYVLPCFTIELLHTVSFRNCQPLHSQTST